MYYNKKDARRPGLQAAAGRQFSQAEFLDLVKKARAAGNTPISLGVGDRDFRGAFLTHEALLKRLGYDDYDKLLKGSSPGDPRVREALSFVKQVIDAQGLPSSFSTLKLGESHFYFHTKPGALMFLMGSFYPSRAFNPPDKGDRPRFPTGLMHYPSGACNECKTITIGGSYVVNVASKNAALAADS